MNIYKTKDYYIYMKLAHMDILPFNQGPDDSFLYEMNPQLDWALSVI